MSPQKDYPYSIFQMVFLKLKNKWFKKTYLDTARYCLGSACIFFAYLFPYSEGGSSDALQQIFALGMLSVASLLFGLSAVTPLLTVALMGGVFLVMNTPNPYIGRQLAGIAGLMLAGLACHVGAYLRRKPDVLEWLLFSVAAAAFINAAEGLLQWFGLVGELYRWVVEPERRGIAFGAFRQTNLFATFLCVGAVCVSWLVHRQKLTEYMAWFLSLVLMFAVAASGSRTGMLELMALALLALLWRKHHTPAVTRLMGGQLLLLGLAMLVLPVAADWHGFGFSSSLVRIAKTGQDARLEIWRDTLKMISERPWLGWGWRDMGYGHYVTLFNNRFDGLLDNAHNLFLQLSVEFGLPLTFLFFCAVLWIFYSAKPWKISSGAETNFINSDKQFSWIILLLIVGIHSMLEYPLWYAEFLFLAGIFFGYLLPVTEPIFIILSEKYKIWSRCMASLSALILLFLALMAWQQYAKVLLIYKIPFAENKSERIASTIFAIDNASDAWMFREHVDAARLGLTVVTPQNAHEVRQSAEKLLHFSAEPKVIEPLLASLGYLNDEEAWLFHAKRFCQAFPSEFQRWYQANSDRLTWHLAEQLPQACRPIMP